MAAASLTRSLAALAKRSSSGEEFTAENPFKPQGPQAVALVDNLLDVRVGAECGAGDGEGTGRRRALGREDTREATAKYDGLPWLSCV